MAGVTMICVGGEVGLWEPLGRRAGVVAADIEKVANGEAADGELPGEVCAEALYCLLFWFLLRFFLRRRPFGSFARCC